MEKWGCPSGFLLHPRRATKAKLKRLGGEVKRDEKGKGKAREVDLDATKENSNGVEEVANGAVKEGDEDEQEVWVVGGSEDGRVIGWEVQSRKVVLDLKASSGEFGCFLLHLSISLFLPFFSISDFFSNSADPIISVAVRHFLPLSFSPLAGPLSLKLTSRFPLPSLPSTAVPSLPPSNRNSRRRI